MDALECDVCGKLYKKPICLRRINVYKDQHPYGDSRFDLCDDCYKKLCEFLKVTADKTIYSDKDLME